MLSINANVRAHTDHREHAWALRTIGQDLADLRPLCLEIEFTGHLYTVRGRTLRKPTAPARRGIAGLIKKWTGPGRRGRQGRDTGWFERTYPLSEIHRLDDTGLLRRKNIPEGPDIYVLGERLRTVGKMLEAKGGQLIKLTLDNHRVAFTFRDRTGAIFNEEHSNSALHRSQQDGNSRRGTGRSRDPWEFKAPKNAADLSTLTNRKLKLAANPAAKR